MARTAKTIGEYSFFEMTIASGVVRVVRVITLIRVSVRVAGAAAKQQQPLYRGACAWFDSFKSERILFFSALTDPRTHASRSLHTLIISDVMSDSLSFIGSGPTFLVSYSSSEASHVLSRALELVGKRDGEDSDMLLDEVRKYLDASSGQEASKEAPPGYNIPKIICRNSDVVKSVIEVCRREFEGAKVVEGGVMEGEAMDVALEVVDRLDSSLGGSAGGREQLFVMGGETTVTLSKGGDGSFGKGGRNQEMALVAAIELAKRNLHGAIVACLGTDGNDGPTTAAGAVVDAKTVHRIYEKVKEQGGDLHGTANGIEYATMYLKRHDSNGYFQKGGGLELIETGPTGTNCADILLAYMGRRS